MTTHIILTAVCYFVFSAGVGAMSPPSDAQVRGFYGWLYRTLQKLAANADRVAEAQFGSIAKLPLGNDGIAASSTSTATFERRVEVATSSGSQ